MKKFGGKLFGAALGFSFGGPIGAVIGAAVGHYIDSSNDKKSANYPGKAQKELTFITSLILLLTGTARADGTVTNAEVDTIKNFFKYQLRYGDTALLLINRIINESLQKVVNLPEICSAIAERTVYEERLYLIRLNYEVAASDGSLSENQEAFIKQASVHLGINEYDLNMVRSTFSSDSAGGYSSGYFKGGGRGAGGSGPDGPGGAAIKDPYALLGITRGCSDEDVHRAYREMANMYHPDKVSHLGKELIDLATSKFTHILEAYEIIKKERGLA
jgi:DnaJ like chaperone protein